MLAIVEILLVEEDNVIRGMLAETIRAISEFEYPHKYVLDDILTHNSL